MAVIDKDYLLKLNSELEEKFQQHNRSSHPIAKYVFRSMLTDIKDNIYDLKDEYHRLGVEFPDLMKYPPHEFKLRCVKADPKWCF